MKKILAISVILNILFIILIILILFSGYGIHKKLDIDDLKIKQPPKSIENPKEERSAYYKDKVSLFEIMPNGKNGIIFLGNSITDGCDWNELFGNSKIINRGIGGDVIEGVIERLDNVVNFNPKKIFLMIGINDLERKDSITKILTNYERLITLIKEKSPRTKIYIQSILPTDYMNNNDIISINKGLFILAEKHELIYVNLFDLLKTDKNELDTVYTHDGVHLNGKGYLLWKKAIEHYINN